MAAFGESVIEQVALAWLESVGWHVRNGAEIAPGERTAEREDCGQVVLARRLLDALARFNPALPAEAPHDAFCRLKRVDGPPAFSADRSLAASDSARAARGE